MAISQKIRFEIFKRDNFTCRYCGKTPPEVTLEIDHIIPLSDGGKDEINNLLTSCFNCNRGKGKISLELLPLSITENLKVLQEQQKQTKEYYKYIEKIELQKNEDLREIGHHFFNLFQKTKRTHNRYIFAGNWKLTIQQFLKIFTKYQIIEAIDISFSKFTKERRVTEYNVFKYMCGILHNWKKATQCRG